MIRDANMANEDLDYGLNEQMNRRIMSS